MNDQLEIRECQYLTGGLGESDEAERNEVTFRFAVAKTGIELMKGLAGAESITGDGMLFDFGCDWSPIMTPKGLKFTVDLAYITEDGSVAELYVLDPEMPFPQATTRTDIRYALEVEKGFFERHGIKVGTTIFRSN